jgi:hypothetical protein
MRTRSIIRQVAAATALALPVAASASVGIDVEVSEIGGGLWHYDYILSGDSFNAPPAAPGPHGFSLYFDYTLYGALGNGSTANATWDLIVEQPDAGFFLDGLFDVLALSTPAGTSQPFGIDFEWLGSGAPTGIQAFEYYYCSDANCDVITDSASGTTRSAAIPLPGSLALVAAGLIGLGLRRARRRSS